MPALIALGAIVLLQRLDTLKKTALAPGEFVRALVLDAPAAGLQHFPQLQGGQAARSGHFGGRLRAGRPC